jgi:UDP-GlcNAc:undecaprenyl-phosphate GlcNAc-1-phosphate transferase
MRDMTTYICVYFGSAYLALALTPLVIWLARRIKAVDYPGIRSVHCLPTPRIGGVAIYLATMAMLVPLLFLGNTIGARFRELRMEVIALLGCATAVFTIGLVDDLRRLPARFKFLMEAAGAVALCVAGVKIGSIHLSPLGTIDLGWFGWVLTVLWIVGVTNAVNMSDGLDGLAAGIVATACAVIAIFAIHGSYLHGGELRQNDIMLALFALALLGSLSGFLFFNFHPAKVFMGDSGSLFIGFVIASASVMCVSKSTALVGLALPVLALGVPIFDMLFSMLRRFLESRSIFAPDRSHLHHRLLELGFTQRNAVILIYGATVVAAGLGLLMLISDSLFALLVFSGALLLLLMVFRTVGVVQLRHVFARLQDKYKSACRERNEQSIFENLELQFRQIRDSDQWRTAVCAAAEKMDFAWLALKTTYADGRVEEELWRPPNGKSDHARIVTMTIPLRSGHDPGISQQLEIAVGINGSLEAAGRRAMLFGRLIDESRRRPLAAPTAGRSIEPSTAFHKS